MQHSRHGLKTIVSGTLPIRAIPLLSPHYRRCLRQYAPDSAAAASSSQDFAILGGGITGLATAYYLTQELPTARITIYESSDRVGGWLSSKRVPVKDGTVLFEAGPRTLRPSSNGVLSARLLQELDLAKDAIFASKRSPAAQNRYLYYPDHLVRMPHPAHGLITNILNLLREPVFEGTIWAGLTEMTKDARSPALQDESVGSFFSRRLSKNLVDRILSGVIHGIYAGDVWQLSVKSLFPGLWRDEAQAGGLFQGMLKNRADGLEVTKREAAYLQEMKNFTWDPLLKQTLAETVAFTLKDGLGMLSDRLARHLMGIGTVTFRTSTAIQLVTPTDDKKGVLIHTAASPEPYTHTNAISTLSPNKLNALRPDAAKQLIPTIPGVTVMTVNLYYRTPDLNPTGFGYLIPQATPFESNPERALGVIFDTAYSPSTQDVDATNWVINNTEELQAARNRGQLVNVNDFAWYNMPATPNIQDHVAKRGTKVTVMLGGHWWDGWPSYPDEKEGLAMAKSLLQRHLNITEEPEAWATNLQHDCIPQYTVGHEQRLRTAHNQLWATYRGRLRVAGNWMAGVGVNDCLRSAWEVVRGLRDGKDGTGLEDVGSNEYVRMKIMVKAGGQGEQEGSDGLK